MLEFLRYCSYDGEGRQHDLFCYALRRVSLRELVNLESLEEMSHASKDVVERILTQVNGPNRLKAAGENDLAWDSRKGLTEKRTPMPTRMTFAGDST